MIYMLIFCLKKMKIKKYILRKLVTICTSNKLLFYKIFVYLVTEAIKFSYRKLDNAQYRAPILCQHCFHTQLCFLIQHELMY